MECYTLTIPLALDSRIRKLIQDTAQTARNALLATSLSRCSSFINVRAPSILGFDDSIAHFAVCIYFPLFPFAVFPEALKQPLYVTGESYGGHYVPSISYYIHAVNTGLKPCPTAVPGGRCVHLPFQGLAGEPFGF